MFKTNPVKIPLFIMFRILLRSNKFTAKIFGWLLSGCKFLLLNCVVFHFTARVFRKFLINVLLTYQCFAMPWIRIFLLSVRLNVMWSPQHRVQSIWFYYWLIQQHVLYQWRIRFWVGKHMHVSKLGFQLIKKLFSTLTPLVVIDTLVVETTFPERCILRQIWKEWRTRRFGNTQNKFQCNKRKKLLPRELQRLYKKISWKHLKKQFCFPVKNIYSNIKQEK